MHVHCGRGCDNKTMEMARPPLGAGKYSDYGEVHTAARRMRGSLNILPW